MNRIFFWCFLLGFVGTTTYAQRHEIGILVGGVNYIGEIGDTQYFNPKHLGYGIIYKRNLTQRIALRAQFSTGKFSANDMNATDLDRRARGFSFSNTYRAWGVGAEVNYVPFPIGEFGTSWTPYLHIGIQRMVTDELYFPAIEFSAVEHGKNMTLSVPFGVGIKFNLGQYWVIAAEVQPQFTFSDNLDGSFPNTEKQPLARQFSTSLSSDWLVFTGISITYAFGRLPCCRD
ncbi:MAG: DUF6089 family protein [Bacteroidetes bacterium]|nr:DUF6089 family protein [Bacteroidota bacterium]MDA0889316.1 DUF6089 family protein [Bacteroidota bacterium]